MSFQWLELRLGEEADRRHREQEILRNLPLAIEELHGFLKQCVDAYAASFGPESAAIEWQGTRISVVIQEERDGAWQQVARVEIAAMASIPGFEVDRSGTTIFIEVGMLPGERIFYRDRELDQYLNYEELTRRILDRALFPKLKE